MSLPETLRKTSKPGTTFLLWRAPPAHRWGRRILVWIETQKGCPQLVACRVLSLLSANRSFDPSTGIDSGGSVNWKHFWKAMSKLLQLWGFHPLCVCVFQQVVWSPGKDVWDENVSFNSNEDRPRCKELPGGEVGGNRALPQRSPLPLPWGRNQKWLVANGIDFSKATDKITGPVFFTTHNIFHALVHSWTAMNDWGHIETDPKKIKNGIQWSDIYRPVMEFEIQHLDQCRGLVPDMVFLQKAASQGVKTRSRSSWKRNVAATSAPSLRWTGARMVKRVRGCGNLWHEVEEDHHPIFN